MPRSGPRAYYSPSLGSGLRNPAVCPHGLLASRVCRGRNVGRAGFLGPSPAGQSGAVSMRRTH
eukprot:3239673-Lingulodinium_polyedra.AAC.1